MRSIERYLLSWIIGALALGSVVVAIVMYLVLLDEMNEVFDDHLAKVARAVASYHHAGHERGKASTPESPPIKELLGGAEIVTLTWTPSGEIVYSSNQRVNIPFLSVEGLSYPRVGQEDWIVYTIVQVNGVAQAAQRVSDRQELAGESATKIFLPLLALVVVVGGLLVFALRRGLQPLDAAARDIALRSVKSLEPVSTVDVPKEIAPLVSSINDLLGRLSDAFAIQRTFLTDAAHELRSPVTAVRLQLQLLKRSGDEASRSAALKGLESGIDRTQHLIEQLLQVARSDPDGEPKLNEPVSLGGLVRNVVGSLSIKAEQRDIDLGATGPSDVVILGDGHQLTILLNNLVENALRYTPAGGLVDVAAGMCDGLASLVVSDNGPGIPESERERVFDRFHRGENAQMTGRDFGGSGLGLAIVRAIADQHHARVTLSTASSGQGLEVRVVFSDAAVVAP